MSLERLLLARRKTHLANHTRLDFALWHSSRLCICCSWLFTYNCNREIVIAIRVGLYSQNYSTLCGYISVIKLNLNSNFSIELRPDFSFFNRFNHSSRNFIERHSSVFSDNQEIVQRKNKLSTIDNLLKEQYTLLNEELAKLTNAWLSQNLTQVILYKCVHLYIGAPITERTLWFPGNKEPVRYSASDTLPHRTMQD